jgi:hypothetical protein
MFTISQDSVDKTVRIFDNFYTTQLVVNGSDYDVVYSYFKGVTANAKIAGNYTALMFRIAQEGGYNIMSLMDVIKGTESNLQINQVMAYYLNTFKSKISLYGVGIIPKPNEAVQRNVVQ